MLGIVLGYVVAGNVIVETVFSWPGVGSYAFKAVRSNDFNAIQGLHPDDRDDLRHPQPR